MRSTIKLIVVVVTAGLALMATAFSAFATPSAPGRAAADNSDRPLLRGVAELAPPAACTDMQATDVAWVTLTADHHIDKQVPAYASGATDITPLFQYSCAPDNTTIVSVFSENGLTIFTDKEVIKAKNAVGRYAYDLETLDGTPLADGQWGVQYFRDKTLLTTGSVAVGKASSDPSQTNTATVQGVVQDQNAQTPIEGAEILVLNPGVTPQDFVQNGEPDSAVYTASRSDSQGAFTLPKKLVRHQGFGMLVVKQGYKSVGNNAFQVNDEADPMSITVSMTK